MPDRDLSFSQIPGNLRLQVVDSHTCGQPTRVILQGHGIPPGSDPRQAQALLRTDRDWVRRAAVLEPRGHRSMFAAAIIDPITAGDDFGLVFMDAAQYPDMCGHATIGAATTLIELGLIALPEPQYSGPLSFGLHTPSGRIVVEADLDRARCRSITFGFDGAWYFGAVPIILPQVGQLSLDVAFAGQWYAFLPAAALGLAVDPAQIGALIGAAETVRSALAAALAAIPGAPTVGNIVWTDPPSHPLAQHRNVPVSAAGSFDRSPCGTATCARMASLVARGDLAPGQPFVNEGLVGTIYHGTAERAASVQGHDAILARVRGQAWITAVSTLIVDPDDPLREGFLA